MISFGSKMMIMNFSQFLELKFLQWQQSQGGRKTVKEFAEHLGFAQSTVSTWWNKTRVPEGENIQKLAMKLGIEIYDSLGLPRPDPDLTYIQSHWEEIPPKARQALREQAETYREKNEPQRVKKTSPAHSRT